jgi:hypothetical protein
MREGSKRTGQTNNNTTIQSCAKRSLQVI